MVSIFPAATTPTEGYLSRTELAKSYQSAMNAKYLANPSPISIINRREREVLENNV